jgi:hypothetical protein
MVAVASLVPVLHLALDPASAVRDLPMARIVDEVREIWRPHMNIVWGNGPETLASGQTVGVLITDAPPPARDTGAPSLGWIEFFGEGRPADRVAVSISGARAMLETGTWLGRPLKTLPPDVRQLFIVRALARALAHEIGHYVLRSKAHPSGGLMRARFTVEDIMDGRRSRFRLTPPEQRQLAAMLSDRAPTPLASAGSASSQALF